MKFFIVLDVRILNGDDPYSYPADTAIYGPYAGEESLAAAIDRKRKCHGEHLHFLVLEGELRYNGRKTGP